MPEKESKSPLVFIIILNFKGADDTIALLDNLRHVEYENYRVLTIENGSQDGSTEKLKSVENKYLNWIFIYNNENSGFAGGCNQAIEIAMQNGADYVLLLNNDTTVLSGFLKPLVELSLFENCLTGGIIYYAPKGDERIWSFGGNLTWGAVPGHLNLLNRKIDPSELPTKYKTDFIPGCCLLIPKHVIEKIGLLDEDYFAYVEDVDYCLRASKAGFLSYVTSLSVIHHKVGTSTGGGYSKTGRFMIAESSVIFVRKHADFFQRSKFVILFWIGIMVATVREGLRDNIDAVNEKVKGYRSGWLKYIHEPRKLV